MGDHGWSRSLMDHARDGNHWEWCVLALTCGIAHDRRRGCWTRRHRRERRARRVVEPSRHRCGGRRIDGGVGGGGGGVGVGASVGVGVDQQSGELLVSVSPASSKHGAHAPGSVAPEVSPAPVSSLGSRHRSLACTGPFAAGLQWAIGARAAARPRRRGLALVGHAGRRVGQRRDEDTEHRRHPQPLEPQVDPELDLVRGLGRRAGEAWTAAVPCCLRWRAEQVPRHSGII